MSRAERRRNERLTRKNPKERTADYTAEVATAIFKDKVTKEIDQKLHDKYYEQACKEQCDNTYSIILCSVALALHDCNPSWTCAAIGRRITKMMEYVSKFPKEYHGDLQRYIAEVEEKTGIEIVVDSVQPKN